MKGYLVPTNLYYDVKDMWCIVTSVLSPLELKILYNAIRVLLRFLRREIGFEVVRKYIPREA